jgi:dihydrolipoamide dehydrogenase
MYDLIIIGSGPAGYVAAIRAGQLGLKTAVIEKDSIGGMCLNWGCIPSKSIMESVKLFRKVSKEASRFGVDGIDKKNISFNWNKAVKRSEGIVKKLTGGVAFLLEKNGVDVIMAEARIVSQNEVFADNRLLKTKHIIIATGSHTPEIKSSVDGLVVSPKELFTEREIPDNIVVAGKTPVAVELAQAFSLMGRKVTLVSDSGSIMPLADDYISSYMLSKLKKEKINVIFNNDLTDVSTLWKDHVLTVGEEKIPCDLIINAKDRNANSIESDITIDYKQGFIEVDDKMETSVKGIFAVGDVNGLSMYAHVGSAQGLFVVNRIVGIEQDLDFDKIPVNMYTQPEAAQIGLTEKKAIDQGYDIKISEFPLSANGKAQTEGNTEGFIRIISEKKYGEVLGVQIVAASATDMINEASAYIQLESTVYDIANTVHTHPTVSEIFMEAGFEAVDKAIHK